MHASFRPVIAWAFAIAGAFGTSTVWAQPKVDVTVTMPVTDPAADKVGVTATAQWSFQLGSVWNGRVTGTAGLSQTLRLADFEFHGDPPPSPKARIGLNWTPKIGGETLSLGFFVGCSLDDPRPRCGGNVGPIQFSEGGSVGPSSILEFRFDLGTNSPPAGPGLPWTFDRIEYSVAAVPETGSGLMFLAGGSLLAVLRAAQRRMSRSRLKLA